MNRIDSFSGDYSWLSNFHLCPVEFEGVIYPSSENAYQAAKTLDLDRRIPFQTYSSGKAKKYGALLEKRPDWDSVRVATMKNILWDKFKRNPDLLEKLLATGDAELTKGVYWHDQFWGNCSCGRPSCQQAGQKRVGRLLMWVREELRSV
jgi:ribA/ribD-fused uncharacterized protein